MSSFLRRYNYNFFDINVVYTTIPATAFLQKKNFFN